MPAGRLCILPGRIPRKEGLNINLFDTLFYQRREAKIAKKKIAERIKIRKSRNFNQQAEATETTTFKSLKINILNHKTRTKSKR
jgi:hypothetical protein